MASKADLTAVSEVLARMIASADKAHQLPTVCRKLAWSASLKLLADLHIMMQLPDCNLTAVVKAASTNNATALKVEPWSL